MGKISLTHQNKKSILVEFCKRTDLHGYKYIVMDELNIFERCFWAVAVVISTGFAVHFTMTAYSWFAMNPVITVIESTHGAIWDIPFPAVTICDLNIISRKSAFRMAHSISLPENLTAEEFFESIRYAPILHAMHMPTDEQNNQIKKIQQVLDFNNVTIEHFFKKLSPARDCNKIVERCMWKNTLYRCDRLFRQVFTHMNLCCTFNYFAVDVEEDDKVAFKGFNNPPRRVASCGYQTALTVLINIDTEDYYSSMIATQGAAVFIDSVYNIPDLDSAMRLINPSTEVLIALSPEQTYATSSMEYFTPEQRNCYFRKEKKLGNIQHYSYHNCIAFKKVERMITACNCVPFYFPYKGSIRTCNFNDLECLETVKQFVEVLDSNVLNTSYERSVCLPECEHYEYSIEVAFGKLSKNLHLNGIALFDGVDLVNQSLLNVFFNDLVSTKYRRDVYLQWQRILAAFGGLLSLMLGFTLVSAFDLIFFFTFRVVYDAVTFPSKNKKQNNKVDIKENEKSVPMKIKKRIIKVSEKENSNELGQRTKKRSNNVRY